MNSQDFRQSVIIRFILLRKDQQPFAPQSVDINEHNLSVMLPKLNPDDRQTLKKDKYGRVIQNSW